MATDSIAEYQTALETLERAKREAAHIVGVVTDGGKALVRWRDIVISNASPAVVFPSGLRGGPSIDAQQWPTGQKIAETLSVYHTALHEAGNAYRRIPDDKRSVVQPPPSS